MNNSIQTNTMEANEPLVEIAVDDMTKVLITSFASLFIRDICGNGVPGFSMLQDDGHMI